MVSQFGIESSLETQFFTAVGLGLACRMLFHWNSMGTFRVQWCQDEKGHCRGWWGANTQGFTITFVPILKYAWGHWFPSCCLLRLLPPFFFSGRSVYIKCYNKKRDWRLHGWVQTQETGLCLPTALPLITASLLPSPNAMSSNRVLKLGWEASHLFIKSDFSPTHSLISSHIDFLTVSDTPDTFLPQGQWFRCALCLECVPPR